MIYAPSSEGQGLPEYALIIALVSIVSIAIAYQFGPTIGNIFSNVVANI